MGNAKQQGTDQIGRRIFLRNSVLTIGGAIAAILGYPVVRYFIFPAVKGEEAKAFTQIARVSQLPVSVPTFVTYEERIKDGWVVTTKSLGAWVVVKNETSVVAFDPHCTHLGCAYYWNPDRNRFLCPCHAGVFDIDGNVISGPPPRPLDRLELRVDGGNILVGKTITSNSGQQKNG
ncbi:MAG: ubiquinol-cytochrome c reductase iron-sulfur subunit [Chloroflexi bacterium]|nr:ubiquinol-cytochrome c reductase iron-sulfur subunit [Chloroflexota bacterium]